MALKIDSTQERWLADRGVPPDLVRKWKSGICFPGTQYLIDVAHVLNIPLEELIRKAPQRKNQQQKAS